MAIDLTYACNVLWECLSSDRRRVAFLLGAGCPFSVVVNAKPLIPDMAGLTGTIVKTLREGTLRKKGDILIERLAEGSADWDVEDALNYLRAIGDVLGPNQELAGLSAEDAKALEGAVAAAVLGTMSVDLPEVPTGYSGLADWLGDIRHGAHPVNVFTTNYDLLIEQALERRAIPYFDGFVGTQEPFLDTESIDEDDIPRRWVRLWKLHGSINWVPGPEASTVVRRTPRPGESPPVIHPSHLKYLQSRRMPYLAMQDRLRQCLLASSATLVTVGYSFGDEHINAVLSEALVANPSAAIFALLHGPMVEAHPALRLAARHKNLFVMAQDGGSVAGQQGAWLEKQQFNEGDFEQMGLKLARLSFVRDA